MILPREFLGQLRGALACPTQRRFRAPALAGSTNSSRALSNRRSVSVIRLRPAPGCRNRGETATSPCSLRWTSSRTPEATVLRQPSCRRDGRHATPAQSHRFGRRPMASHTFVHHGDQRRVLHSNPFDRRRVLHDGTIGQNPKIDKAILLKLFFRRSLVMLWGPLAVMTSINSAPHGRCRD